MSGDISLPFFEAPGWAAELPIFDTASLPSTSNISFKSRTRNAPRIFSNTLRLRIMANRAHKGFLTVDDALEMDKSDIRRFPMKYQHSVKVELLGAAKMFVKDENNTL